MENSVLRGKLCRTMRVLMSVGTLAVVMTAAADPVAWWRFEGMPGTSTQGTAGELVNSIAGSTVPGLTPATMNGSTFSAEAAYLPKFVNGFSIGRKIYDPISGKSYDNTGSLRLRDAWTKTPTTCGGAYVPASTLPLSGSFTMECFFRVTTTTAADLTGLGMAPILTIQTQAYAEAFSIQFHGGKLYCRWNSDKATGDLSNAVSLDKWHHIAAVFDAENQKVRVFLDYACIKEAGSQAAAIAGVIDTTRFCVGLNDQTSGRNFPGEVDEVRVSGSALTAEQFLRFANQGDGETEVLYVDSTAGMRSLYDSGNKWWGGLEDDLYAAADSFKLPIFCTRGGATAIAEVADPVADVIYPKFTDASGMPNGTAIDMNRTSESYGSYVQVPYRSNGKFFGDTDEGTIEFFAKFKSNKDHKGYFPVVGEYQGSGDAFRWGFSGDQNTVVTGNKVMFNIRQVNKSDGTVAGSKQTTFTIANNGTFADGKWHHWALVTRPVTKGDGSVVNTVFGYIDYGKMAFIKVELDPNCRLALGNANLTFGGMDQTARLCDVIFDEIRITKKALSPREFLQTQHREGDTAAWIHFNGDYKIGPYGSPAQNDGVAESGTAPTFVSKVVADSFCTRGDITPIYSGNTKAIRFTGKAHAAFNPQPMLAGVRNKTVEAFVKINDIAGSDGQQTHLLTESFDGNYARPDWSIRTCVNNNGKLTSYLVWSTAEDSRLTGVITLQKDGKWHHLALTMEDYEKDGETLTAFNFYVDYVLQATVSDAKRYLPVGQVPGFFFGETYGSGHDFEIDEFRVTEGVLPVEDFLSRVKHGLSIIVR